MKWFQQDDATQHYGRIVRDYLQAGFPNKRVGRRGFPEWPARSSDLTPLNFHIRGYYTSEENFNRPYEINNFKARIRDEIKLIQPQTSSEVLEEFRNQLCHGLEVNGMH